LKKNGTNFSWNEECEIAFQGFKRHLTLPPLLLKSFSGEMSYLYLTVLESVMSGAIIPENEGI